MSEKSQYGEKSQRHHDTSDEEEEEEPRNNPVDYTLQNKLRNLAMT